ncbi:MAG TPA: WYL domain-containing protein [Acidimicrobiales bacterium]|nr:WYL domain-containing protein [Acidimicrobiales bacterium]
MNLVAALLEAELPLTAEQLRERVPGYPEEQGAFRRAFERDKETLREMGVPVTYEQIPMADLGLYGYRISKDDYYLRDPGLAPDELAALHLAASAVRVEGANGMHALWKLGGDAFNQGSMAAVAALPGAAHLVGIFGAISDRRRVSFKYRDRDREVEPQRLSFRTGHWYLSARELVSGEERRFRLDRIESDVAIGDDAGAFQPPPETEAAPVPWQLGGDDLVIADLLIDADQAGWAVGQLGDESVTERRADGSVRLAVSVTNRDAFRSFVLGFLDHAEILGPDELRDDMVGWLQRLCPA